MNPRYIPLSLLFIILLLAGSGNSETAHQIKPTSFSLLYSNNVLGEYEPCG
jgi:hypothetical protein